MRRYPVTKIVAEVTNPYNGKSETIVLEGEGHIIMDDSHQKKGDNKYYEAVGRHMEATMILISEKVTPSE